MGITKANANAKEIRVTPASADMSSPLQCFTLEKDETTRCSRLATKGDPQPHRCDIHDEQYRILYKNYNIASEVVDDIKCRAGLPTKEQIDQYSDWRAALEEARWVRKYLESIRMERTGRDIHQRRFFLKVDVQCHEHRLELLEGEMVRALDVLDVLQEKAYELYQSDGTLHAMNGPTTAEVGLEKQSKHTTDEVLRSIRSPDTLRFSMLPIPTNKIPALPTTLAVGAEDLIEVALRDQREQMIAILKPLTDFELFTEVFIASSLQPEIESSKAMLEKLFLIYQQFARRVIFHQPTVFIQSLDRVSLRDIILDDFPIDDLARFLDQFLRPLEYPLMWLKDAILDVFAVGCHDTACSASAHERRFPFLGGWVFNHSHTASMSNEAWWFLLKILRPPANVESRLVRLCNSFDELVSFLSFEAFGLVPSPGFCNSPSHFDIDDPALARNHLSLSGIIVADMVATPRPPHMRGPMPTTRNATKPDRVVWSEHETRAYMFGAMRNEPDAFVEAFLRELYARPDLFQVVLRSETAPDREVEMFGSRSSSNTEALPAMRVRYFEGPASLYHQPAPELMRGKWEVTWSALDVLFGKSEERQGYLVDVEQKPEDWFFRLKTFPVTYFVILDTVPYRDRSVLARNVSWAALRAQGYADGTYTTAKYVAAADMLLERCARERLGWMPKDMEWGITKMEDQMRSCCIM